MNAQNKSLMVANSEFVSNSPIFGTICMGSTDLLLSQGPNRISFLNCKFQYIDSDYTSMTNFGFNFTEDRKSVV